jgi:transposase InsO family protein
MAPFSQELESPQKPGRFNAVAESFFATLKNEEATGTYRSKADAHAGIANYIHGFYNPTRRHSALGHLSPNNYARTLVAA